MSKKAIEQFNEKTQTKPKDPDQGKTQTMVEELLFINPLIPPLTSERKKLLLQNISLTPVSIINIDEWLTIFKLCENKKKSCLWAISSKINETIRLINESTELDSFLKQICESNQLPSKLIKAACDKSKKNHR